MNSTTRNLQCLSKSSFINELKTLVEQHFVAFNQSNLDLVDEICAADIVTYDAAWKAEGCEALKQGIIQFRTAFPDSSKTITALMIMGNRVKVRWQWQGTHKGYFRGIAPTGLSLTSEGVTLFTIVNGKIQETRTLFNASQFIDQIKAAGAA